MAITCVTGPRTHLTLRMGDGTWISHFSTSSVLTETQGTGVNFFTLRNTCISHRRAILVDDSRAQRRPHSTLLQNNVTTIRARALLSLLRDVISTRYATTNAAATLHNYNKTFKNPMHHGKQSMNTFDINFKSRPLRAMQEQTQT